mgnify:CR=1 FL=1
MSESGADGSRAVFAACIFVAFVGITVRFARLSCAVVGTPTKCVHKRKHFVCSTTVSPGFRIKQIITTFSGNLKNKSVTTLGPK